MHIDKLGYEVIASNRMQCKILNVIKMLYRMGSLVPGTVTVE